MGYEKAENMYGILQSVQNIDLVEIIDVCCFCRISVHIYCYTFSRFVILRLFIERFVTETL